MTITEVILILGLYLIMALWIPISGMGEELTAVLKKFLRGKRCHY